MSKRTKQIVEMLKTNGGSSVKELAYELNVTEMTIRRDIKELKETGIVKNVSGAILLAVNDENFYADYITKKQEGEFLLEKQRIGQMAANCIGKEDVIYIDVGTTTVKIIDNLAEQKDVMVVCSTMNSLHALEKIGHENYCLTGGRLQKQSEMLTSAKGLEMLNEFGFTKVFISAAGVSEKLGVTCVNPYEVDYKKAAMKRALEKYLIVDSSKFGTVRMNCFTTLNEFDVIITDKNLSEDWQEIINDYGIRLIMC